MLPVIIGAAALSAVGYGVGKLLTDDEFRNNIKEKIGDGSIKLYEVLEDPFNKNTNLPLTKEAVEHIEDMTALIPKRIKEQIPKLYDTEEQDDPVVYVKLFLDNFTWYITELSIDDNICFGYVVSPFGSELGYFSLNEIEEVKGSLGTKVERDLYFEPTALSQIKRDS